METLEAAGVSDPPRANLEAESRARVRLGEAAERRRIDGVALDRQPILLDPQIGERSCDEGGQRDDADRRSRDLAPDPL